MLYPAQPISGHAARSVCGYLSKYVHEMIAERDSGKYDVGWLAKTFAPSTTDDYMESVSGFLATAVSAVQTIYDTVSSSNLDRPIDEFVYRELTSLHRRCSAMRDLFLSFAEETSTMAVLWDGMTQTWQAAVSVPVAVVNAVGSGLKTLALATLKSFWWVLVLGAAVGALFLYQRYRRGGR